MQHLRVAFGTTIGGTLTEVNAKFLAIAFPFMCVIVDQVEFWDRAKSAEGPSEEPPALLDENGSALVSLDFIRINTVYGRQQSQVFQVRMPKTAVPEDLAPGSYSPLTPTVNYNVSSAATHRFLQETVN